MRYTVVLEHEGDGGYVVSVPALPGCVSQGDTRAEALSNIREAIELYIEDCRDAGDPVPTEAGKEFVEIEVAKGGHMVLRREEPHARVVIPTTRRSGKALFGVLSPMPD
jgi:predicted RNase H-like HicB family nuclease